MNQRFLKRLHLIKNQLLILREAAYHRAFDAEENLPHEVLWKEDTDHNECRIFSETPVGYE